jgi:preprotein translocase subunit SecB
MAEEAQAPGTPGGARQVLLQKIYLKDASVEIPLAPDIYTRREQPQLDVNLTSEVKQVRDDLFNVTLSVTVTSKIGEDVAFLVEVHQAGLIVVRGFDNPEERGAVLGSYCPNLIFPFAREAVADLVQKAGFPPLLLQPINFDALYLEQLQRQRGGAAEAGRNSPIILQ